MSGEKIAAKRADPAPGTRLAIEIGTPMVAEIQGAEAKIKCTLAGMQVGEYLILRPPRAMAVKLFQVGKSPKAVVRYLFDGRVFGFETAMIGAILDPVALIFLSYPKVVSEHNLRAAPRHECNLPVTIMIDATQFSGMILDLSPTGCRAGINCAVLQTVGGGAPALGAVLKIDLQLPDETGRLALVGTVKNIEQDKNGTAFGVAFAEIGDAARAQIVRYLDDTN